MLPRCCQVGEELDGRWYGASYGWEWPHGFYNIAMAALLAGVSCFQLTGDQKYLELPRNQMRRVMALGRVEALDLSKMSLAEHWTPQLSAMAGRTIAGKYLGKSQSCMVISGRPDHCRERRRDEPPPWRCRGEQGVF